MDLSASLLQGSLKLYAKGESLLGKRAWRLLQGYGKFMAGPDAGSYVSALSPQAQADIATQLVAGNTLNIHLMHGHRSGDPEVASLRWDGTQLIMVFGDRECPA